MAHFKTWTCEIRTDKRKNEEAPLRVMLMADLHDRLWGEGQRMLLKAVDAWTPDLLLCAGDMVLSHGGAQSENTLLLFEGLAKRRIPVVAGNGNHETRMREKEGVLGEPYQLQYSAGNRRDANEKCEKYRGNQGSLWQYRAGGQADGAGRRLHRPLFRK